MCYCRSPAAAVPLELRCLRLYLVAGAHTPGSHACGEIPSLYVRRRYVSSLEPVLLAGRGLGDLWEVGRIVVLQAILADGSRIYGVGGSSCWAR